MLYLSSISTVSADRYYPLAGWHPAPRTGTSTLSNVSATAPGIAGTITELAITSGTAASDATEIWALFKNGIATGDTITVPNGGTHAVVTGLSIPSAATDQWGWHYPLTGSAVASPVDITTRFEPT